MWNISIWYYQSVKNDIDEETIKDFMHNWDSNTVQNQAHGSCYHESSYAYIDFEKPDTSGTSACHLRYKKHAWFIYAYVVS